MSGSVFGWVCSHKDCQSTGQRLSFTSMKSWRANRTPKMKCIQTFTQVWVSPPHWISMSVINTTYIMNASTAFNYSWPLATYWYCVCSWVIYAPETWISAFIVHLPAISMYVLCAPKHVCLCPYIIMSLCMCMLLLTERAGGSGLQSGSCMLKHGVITITLQAPLCTTYPAGQFSTALATMSENWRN